MKTLKSKLTISGNGLMSGVRSELEVCPLISEKKDGINFYINGKKVEADVENVVSTEHCVVLANVKEGADTKIALIEHFMAACAICGIDNLEIHFKSQGWEMPILDGSAKVWVEQFNEIGYQGESAPVQPLKEPVYFLKDKSSVVLLPNSHKTKITYCVNFNHPELKNRWVNLDLDKNLNEIIEARTFGYLKDLDMLQKAGFSKGVTIENTVGMTHEGYTTDLRSEFELPKHKILDIIGDLYLTGTNPLKLQADILVKEAGHGYHVETAKILKQKLI